MWHRPRLRDFQETRELTRTALMASLTAVGAWLAFPLPLSPVPLTLQVVFMLMSGMLLGGRQGAASQILYLAMGALGLPVFSRGGAGVGVLLDPTGGYLVGFIPRHGSAGSLLNEFAPSPKKDTGCAGADMQ